LSSHIGCQKFGTTLDCLYIFHGEKHELEITHACESIQLVRYPPAFSEIRLSSLPLTRVRWTQQIQALLPLRLAEIEVKDS
jgi:hypothetical protein